MQEKIKLAEEMVLKVKGLEEVLVKREEAIETYKKRIIELEFSE
jgi:hypothetical protein